MDVYCNISSLLGAKYFFSNNRYYVCLKTKSCVKCWRLKGNRVALRSERSPWLLPCNRKSSPADGGKADKEKRFGFAAGARGRKKGAGPQAAGGSDNTNSTMIGREVDWLSWVSIYGERWRRDYRLLFFFFPFLLADRGWGGVWRSYEYDEENPPKCEEGGENNPHRQKPSDWLVEREGNFNPSTQYTHKKFRWSFYSQMCSTYAVFRRILVDFMEFAEKFSKKKSAKNSAFWVFLKAPIFGTRCTSNVCFLVVFF